MADSNEKPTETAPAAATPAAEESKPVELSDALKQKVEKQILFYFSDANLDRDKFMRNKIASNPEGWVSLSVLLTFNRLKQLTTDEKAILKIFENSDVLDVDTEKAALKRKEKYAKEDTSGMARSLYIEGYKTELTLEDFEALFEGKGKCEYIKLRKAPSGNDGDQGASQKFNGSLFVQFADRAQAEAVLKEGVDKLEVNGDKPTSIEMMDKWYESHAAEKEKLKRKLEEEEEIDLKNFEGCCMKFVTTKEDLDREYLAGLFGDEAKDRVAFIEFNRKDTEGVIRFRNVEAIKDAVEVFKKDSNFSSVAMLEGEEQTKYLETVKEALKNNRKGNKRFQKKKKARR